MVEPHCSKFRIVFWVSEYSGVVQYSSRWEIFELRHDKSNKVTVCPAKTQISLGICPVWSDFAVCMKKALVLSYPLSAQQRLWSDWADAQADLSLCWAHSHFAGFVVSRLIWFPFWCIHTQTKWRMFEPRVRISHQFTDGSKVVFRLWFVLIVIQRLFIRFLFVSLFVHYV